MHIKICFGFLIIKDEKFSIYKIIGAIIGFCGIISINFTGKIVKFSLSDILIILASICTVLGSLTSKKGMKDVNPITMTGLSQLFGAILLGEIIFRWQYFASFLFIALGIVLGNLKNNAEN